MFIYHDGIGSGGDTVSEDLCFKSASWLKCGVKAMHSKAGKKHRWTGNGSTRRRVD